MVRGHSKNFRNFARAAAVMSLWACFLLFATGVSSINARVFAAPAQAVTSAVPAKSTAKLTASELYMKAREFFAAGRYPEAIQYAAASQRRSPNTKVATVLMAQSYYRIGNTPRAAKLFLSVGSSDIPREAGVDYLLTMFAARRYREVIKGFPIVPDNHPYRDVAKYYTGVSFMHFKLYQKAQAYLRTARKIPPTLNSQRRQLLSEIDRILDNERQGVFDQPQQYAYQSQQYYALPPPPEMEAPRSSAPGAPGPAKPSSPPLPKAATTYSVKPSVGLKQVSTHRDFNGLSQSQEDKQIPSASLALDLKHLGKPRPFGGQPSIDLNLTPSYESTDSKKSTSALVADAADPTNVQNVQAKTDTSSFTISQAYGLSGEYPVSEPVDIGAGYKVKQDRTRGSSKADLTTTTPSAKIVAEMGMGKFDASWQADQIADKRTPDANRTNTTIKLSLARNSENTTTTGAVTKIDNSKPAQELGIKSVTQLDLGWVRNFDDYSLGITGNKTDRTRGELMAGKTVLNETSAKIEGTLNMSFGVSLVTSGTMYQYANLVVLNGGAVKDGPDEAMANGTGKRLLVTLKVSPVSFVAFSASYDYTDRSLSVGEASLAKKMQTEDWSQQTVTTLNISANYAF